MTKHTPLALQIDISNKLPSFSMVYGVDEFYSDGRRAICEKLKSLKQERITKAYM